MKPPLSGLEPSLAKPTKPRLCIENIPDKLKLRKQWVMWNYEWAAGREKWTKVPHQTNGQLASSTDPTTWTDFGAAVKASETFDGLGITCADGLSGIDLDHCFDNGELSDLATRSIRTMNTYAEITPSGVGIRIFYLGTLPASGRRNAKLGAEMYDTGRFLTVTGQHIDGTPTTVEERTAEAAQVHAFVFGDPKPATPKAQAGAPSTDLDDTQLIARATRAKNGAQFTQLWGGSTAGYGSQSEADLALCGHLAFWTAGKPAQMDRLFRSSGLMRDKWDERHSSDGATYGSKTIAKAIGSTDQFYTGNGHQPPELHAPLAKSVAIFKSGNESAWPAPLDGAAFHGLAGDVVRAIMPNTEADPAALLINFLVAAGNAIGRGPYASVGATRHYPNLFAVLVGETAKGRKGTSWDPIRELFNRSDPTWAEGHVASGLSSGEGVIWAVRDQIEKPVAIKLDGKPTGEFTHEITDEGVRDKRLLVLEGEYASVLKAMAREGNTLSPVVRLAWDTGNLRTLVKNSPAQATGAHISILGHVTRHELLRHLSDTEQANGFGNRFLWVCTKRAQVLPEGGGDPAYGPLVTRLHDVLVSARQIGQVQRNEDARRAWAAIYQSLSEGKPGLLGAVTARSEAQVLRLSTLYALLDASTVITGEHLSAAIAVWDYCEASAKYIFGSMLGDPLADKIMEAMRRGQEMTRTAISGLFGRHEETIRIDAALALLAAQGEIIREQRVTNGRTAEVWRAA